MSATKKSPIHPTLIAIPVVIALTGLIPRAVVAMVGIDGNWAAFLYQYLLGFLVFGIGLLVIRISGACDFSRSGDRTWYNVLIFGYLAYATLHGVLTWLTVAVPFKGS